MHHATGYGGEGDGPRARKLGFRLAVVGVGGIRLNLLQLAFVTLTGFNSRSRVYDGLD